MTLDEWLAAYVLRFGAPTHSGWKEGEQEFCEQAALSLGLETDPRASQLERTPHVRAFQLFREEYARVADTVHLDDGAK
jgi:hypothetical protein